MPVEMRNCTILRRTSACSIVVILVALYMDICRWRPAVPAFVRSVVPALPILIAFPRNKRAGIFRFGAEFSRKFRPSEVNIERRSVSTRLLAARNQRRCAVRPSLGKSRPTFREFAPPAARGRRTAPAPLRICRGTARRKNSRCAPHRLRSRQQRRC